MVVVRDLLDSVKVFLEATEKATTSLSEEDASSRLSNTDAKSSCYSVVLLACWNLEYVAFKWWYSLN